MMAFFAQSEIIENKLYINCVDKFEKQNKYNL